MKTPASRYRRRAAGTSEAVAGAAGRGRFALQRRRRQRLGAIALAAFSALAAFGCGPDHATQVEQRRRCYQARANGFVVGEQDLEAAPSPAAGVTSSGAIAASGRDVSLHFLLQRRCPAETAAPATLPALTLDIAQVSDVGVEKRRYRRFVQLDGVGEEEVARQLEMPDVAYAPGDRFIVAVRAPVPERDRGEYREFTPP